MNSFEDSRLSISIEASSIKKEIIENDLFSLQERATKGDIKLLEEGYYIAIYLGKPEICDFLIKLGVNCNIHKGPNIDCEWMPDPSIRRTHIKFAIKDGFSDFLMDNLDLGVDVSTPLIDALRRGYFDIAELMYQTGCRVDFNDNVKNIVLYEMLHKCTSEWREKIFLNNASFLNMPDIKRNRFIYWAARDNDTHLLKRVLTDSFGINKPHKNGNTALHVACDMVAIETMKLLLDNGADVNSLNNKCETPLLTLCKESKYPACIHDKLKKDKHSKLSLICEYEKRNDLRSLFHWLDNLYDSSGSEDNKLLKCPDYSKLTIIALNLLLNYPHNINHQNIDGNSVLHLAAKGGIELNCIEILIKNGADVNLKNKEGQTPIFFAYREEHFNYLYAMGADLDILDSNQTSLLEYALLNWSSLDNVKQLFQLDLPTTKIEKSHIQNTLEYLIQHHRFYEVAFDYLITFGGNINIIFENGKTPLDYAYCDYNDNFIKYLVKKGFNINEIDKEGNTLHHLVIRDFNHYFPKQIVEFLCLSGVDVNTKNSQGLTPLQCLFHTNNSTYLKLSTAQSLLECGANALDLMSDNMDEFKNSLDTDSKNDFDKLLQQYRK